MRNLGGQREWAGCRVPTQGQGCRRDLRASSCTPGVPVHLQGGGTSRGNVLILQLMRAEGLVLTNGQQAQLWGQHLGNSQKGEHRDPTTDTCAFLQACAHTSISKNSTSHLDSESAGIPATLSWALSEGRGTRDGDWPPGVICSGGDRL